ncbi:MAG: hypothetical protein ACP5DX_16515 [Paracoccaceae bacterium]
MTLLEKIAREFERAAEPFAFENARFAALPKDVKTAENPVPRHELAPGVWLDYEADRGVETIMGGNAAGEGIRMQVSNMGCSRWYTLSYDLPVAPLKEARYFGELLRASSEGVARFRMCLRYILPDGFQDRFAREVVVLTGGEQENLLFIKIDPELADRARSAEVLFFFEGRSFDVTLHSAEAVLV